MSKPKYIFFVDGAYSPTRDQGGIGIVCYRDGEMILNYNNAYKNTTNNRMEIQAVISALKCVNNPVDLTIVTDSQYVLGCATKDWKKEKNTDLWEIFDKEYERVLDLCGEVKFDWTKGHENSEGNNFADMLAVKASQWILD